MKMNEEGVYKLTEAARCIAIVCAVLLMVSGTMVMLRGVVHIVFGF